MPFPTETLTPDKGLYPGLGAIPTVPPDVPRQLPKLAVPIRFSRTGLATVEQGSLDEIAACVYAIVATERGSRLEETDYGVEEVAFDGFPPDLDEWLVQIGIWEPRASVRTQAEIDDLLVRLDLEVGRK